MKRGQVSLFIILGILVIVMIVFLFMNSPYFNKPFEEKVDPVVQPLYDQYKDCMEDAGGRAIYAIEHSGGYATEAEFSNDFGIAYYYYLGENHLPTKTNIEKELAAFIEYDITQNCGSVENDLNFDEVEQTGNVKAKARIDGDFVIFDITLPIQAKKGDLTYNFQQFNNIKRASYLNILYNAASEITQEQMKHEEICVNCIHDIALTNDVYVEMNQIEEDTMFILEYIDERTNETVEEFYFVNKYELAEPLE